MNFHLKKKHKVRNVYLINHSKNIKPSHLNRGKLHLNQKGSEVLGDVFLKQISTVFNDTVLTKFQLLLMKNINQIFHLRTIRGLLV